MRLVAVLVFFSASVVGALALSGKFHIPDHCRWPILDLASDCTDEVMCWLGQEERCKSTPPPPPLPTAPNQKILVPPPIEVVFEAKEYPGIAYKPNQHVSNLTGDHCCYCPEIKRKRKICCQIEICTAKK